MRRSHIVLATALSMSTACKESAAAKFPATEAGAREVLSQFTKPGANAAALSLQLRPTSADYAAVFEGPAAAKLEAAYGPAWDKGAMVISGKPEQTEVRLSFATSEDLKTGGPGAQNLPGGYKDVATQLKRGVVIYAFKFVKPGQDLGMAFDGLTHVNGHWVIFPKPWRVLH